MEKEITGRKKDSISEFVFKTGQSQNTEKTVKMYFELGKFQMIHDGNVLWMMKRLDGTQGQVDNVRCMKNALLKNNIRKMFSLGVIETTFGEGLTYLLLSAIRVVSSAYLRLLIFLPAVLIPACTSSSPAFSIMYSAYKLNKQSQYIYLTYSFPNSEPIAPCPVLSAASWLSYRFLRRQVR